MPRAVITVPEEKRLDILKDRVVEIDDGKIYVKKVVEEEVNYSLEDIDAKIAEADYNLEANLLAKQQWMNIKEEMEYLRTHLDTE